MKRKHLFINYLDCKRFKVGKCHYCNSSIYISDINNLFSNKFIKLTCNHYCYINCIDRFLPKNTGCHRLSMKKRKEPYLIQQFKNLNININYFIN